MRRALLTSPLLFLLLLACSRPSAKGSSSEGSLGESPRGAPPAEAACPPATWVPNSGLSRSYLPDGGRIVVRSGTCNADSECTEKPNGRCVATGSGRMPSINRCYYDDCGKNGDCSSGKVCSCGGGSGTTNVCVAGNCNLSSQCSAGLACKSEPWVYQRTSGMYCETSKDECGRAGLPSCKPREACAYSGHLWRCESVPVPPVG